MNIKLHTPKSLMTGSGMSSIKQFLLALLATTISIVLTFGTAAVIDYHKKKAAKKEMVKMVIYDFDKTIEQLMNADTAFHKASLIQQELAVHPEYFDSLHTKLLQSLMRIDKDYSEITENIFSTNIETFNTIGDVNFVNEVSNFYICRRKYKETVLDCFQADLSKTHILQSINNLFKVNLPEYYYMNWIFLQGLKDSRDKCMKMMNLSEDDMKSFSKKFTNEKNNSKMDSLDIKMFEEYNRAEELIQQAREKYKP